MHRKDIKELGITELQNLCLQNGGSSFTAKQILDWIYDKRSTDFLGMTNLPAGLRSWLEKNYSFSSLGMEGREHSVDGTQKFLFRLQDGICIESVFIPDKNRATLCLSVQAGCRRRCGFCVSGIRGLLRDLSQAEILNQYLQIDGLIKPHGITNIVFMGTGEPLDNFMNTVHVIELLTGSMGFSRKKITLSTCGITPMIYRLADMDTGINLTVSLHSAQDRERTRIMPVNRRYPLEELMASLRYFSKRSGSRITFEYVLIGGLNCSTEHAKILARYVSQVSHKLNLIPYNESAHFGWKRPCEKDIRGFEEVLKKKNVFFTLRKPRGQDISAACGQLYVHKHGRKRPKGPAPENNRKS